MKTRPLGTISLICLVVTTLWLALFIYGVASKGTVETFEQALVSVVKLDALFYLTYVNAALVTLSATLLFACLYVYCKLTAPEWSAMGLVFVPVYSVLNLFVRAQDIANTFERSFYFDEGSGHR